MADDNARLAEQRTDLSEDRTVLANERTFASWLRTGYAGIGIGLAFNALFSRVDPSWIPKLIATVFLLIAIIIFVAAERRACAIFARLETHQVKTVRIATVRVITAANVLATGALVVGIWLFTFKPT